MLACAGMCTQTLTAGQQPNRIICCGHSLGGAVAALGAHQLSLSLILEMSITDPHILADSWIHIMGILLRLSCLRVIVSYKHGIVVNSRQPL